MKLTHNLLPLIYLSGHDHNDNNYSSRLYQIKKCALPSSLTARKRRYLKSESEVIQKYLQVSGNILDLDLALKSHGTNKSQSSNLF